MSAKRNKALDKVREFNAAHPYPVIVTYQGRTFKTWTWAAINWKDEACVFIDSKEFPEPIPLHMIEVVDIDAKQKAAKTD